MDDLRANLPGATDIAIQNELLLVIRDACEDGYIWRETIQITLVASQVIYPVVIAGAEIVQVFSVDHATLDVSDVSYEFGNVLINSAVPGASHTSSPLYLVAALRPTLSPGSDVEMWVPQDMWSEHFQLFASGVKGRMMAQMAKPFSNPGMAQIYYRDYSSRKAVARRQVALGNQVGGQTWSFPIFAPRSLR